MTSDEKTLLPSLLNLIRSDLFTFKNITSSVTLIANEDDILGNLSGWGAVVSMMPLEFFDIINSIEDMVTIEKFDKKYIRNPKMWRPLMILNKCPTIMNFDFEYIRYYNIEKLSNIISVLVSRVQSE